MRHYIFLLLLVPILFPYPQAKLRQQFVSEYDVAQHLNRRYDPQIETPDVFFRLAKKRVGWLVQQVRYDKKSGATTVLKEELCWSATSRRFLPITLLRPLEIRPFSYYFNANPYYNMSDRLPYYGYEGWAEDVIADFEGTDEDTTLEGLGRAYEVYACGFLSNQYGFHNPGHLKKPLEERVALFTDNMDKAIATFTKLREANPNYAMLVGQPQTKLSNTYLFAWLNLAIAGKPDLAAKYLVADLYDPLMLSFARSILNSCPENAILFTQGDNDTFPLYYVQQKEKIRTDVEIVNLSLLNAYHIVRWYQQDRKLKMSMDARMYEDTQFNTLSMKAQLNTLSMDIINDKPPTLDWAGFLTNLKNELARGGTEGKFSLPKCLVRIPFSGAKDLNISDTVTGNIFFDFDKRYLTLEDLVLADIIASNLATRPICMTGLNSSVPNILSSQFMQRGGHNRLVPENYYPYRDKEILWNWLDAKHFANYYTHLSAFDTLCTDRQAVGPFVDMFRYDFSCAMLKLADTDSLKVQELALWHEQKFPRKSWPYSNRMINYVKALLKVGQVKKAQRVTNEIIEDEEKMIIREKGINDESNYGVLEVFCQEMSIEASTFQMPDWARELNAKADEFFQKRVRSHRD